MEYRVYKPLCRKVWKPLYGTDWWDEETEVINPLHQEIARFEADRDAPIVPEAKINVSGVIYHVSRGIYSVDSGNVFWAIVVIEPSEVIEDEATESSKKRMEEWMEKGKKVGQIETYEKRRPWWKLW